MPLLCLLRIVGLKIFIDAGIIGEMTGAQYEGINIFERQTRHFWVFGEAWNDMPPLMRPDLALALPDRKGSAFKASVEDEGQARAALSALLAAGGPARFSCVARQWCDSAV